MIWNALLLAMQEIRRNLLRSFLTILGIVIGIAAVVVMVTVGDGVTLRISTQIASLGSNLLMIRAGGRGVVNANPFLMEDIKAIREEINYLKTVAPSASKSIIAIFGNQNWGSTATGVTNDYLEAGNWVIQQGRKFNESELRAGAMSCIVGYTVWKELLHSDENIIGQKIRLQKLSCEIIGILESKGMIPQVRDQDDIILLPLRAFQRRIAGNQDISVISVSVEAGYSIKMVKKQLHQLLRKRRHLSYNEQDDFFILDTKQIAQLIAEITTVMTSLVGIVAAVSLLVGGIGIMNVMLVSVTERTREIGTRMAIGALETEVMLQFLVEAVALSSLGGIVGIILAVIASVQIAKAIEVPFALNVDIIIVASLFSVGVGLVFGYFPARRAARLDPIEALRHE